MLLVFQQLCLTSKAKVTHQTLVDRLRQHPFYSKFPCKEIPCREMGLISTWRIIQLKFQPMSFHTFQGVTQKVTHWNLLKTFWWIEHQQMPCLSQEVTEETPGPEELLFRAYSYSLTPLPTHSDKSWTKMNMVFASLESTCWWGIRLTVLLFTLYLFHLSFILLFFPSCFS